VTPLDLREEVPALADTTYLNYGAHGPSLRRVTEAVSGELETVEREGLETGPYEAAFESYERSRERIAGLLGADPDAVALTASTSDGLARIACALPFGEGDTVVRTDLEHPAGVLPWQRFKRKGLSVEVLETERGRIDSDAFAAAVADAEAVCFSALTWTHGTRLPVAELVEIARDAGAFTIVDAVQLPGQAPVDVTEWGADVVAGAGHKWLLGPWGAGFVYVDPDRVEQLVPSAVGYRGASTEDGELAFEPDARRLEIGSTSPGPHAGLAAAIEAIESVGLDAIEARIETLTDRLKTRLPDDRLLSPREFHSGLVTVDAADPEATVERLSREGIVVRSLPHPDAVRVSVHAVTTEAEVDRVAEALSN